MIPNRARVRFHAAMLLIGTSLIALAGTAGAQSADASPPGEEAGAEAASDTSAAPERTLNTVTVTAQRREQALTDVPIAITALTAETLEQAGVADIDSLQQIVPGVTFNFAGAHFQPTIRGVGTQVSGPGLPSNVAIYVDGFYRPNAVANNFQLNDIASVQVLKGPQGTLYGRNATGGAILVETRSPEFQPVVDAKISYSSFNDLRAGAYASGPFTDKLAGSVAFYSRTSDSYNDNLVDVDFDDERRTTVARGKLLYEPTDRARFELALEHSDVHDPNTFLFANYDGISAGNFVPGAIVANQPYEYSNDYRPKFDSQSTGVFLKGSWDLDGFSLQSFTSFETQENSSGYDVDGSSVDIQHVDFNGDQETMAQEFILSSENGGNLEWLAGAYFFKDEGSQTLLLSTPPGYFEISSGGVNTKSFALYGDATYQFAPSWYINGGLRFSEDQLDEYFRSAFTVGLTEAEKTFSALTPRISLRHELTDNSSVYVSYNAGYKTGGFNPTSFSTAFVRPEKIDAYEVGYKRASALWDFNVAGYFYAYDNLQVTAYQGPVTSLVNAAKAEIYGTEADATFRITDEFTLIGAAAYVHAEYEDFPGAPQYVYDPLSGITVSPGDASGNPMVNAPELTASLTAAYVRETAVGQIALNASLSYQSETFFDAFQTTKQPAYTLLNLRAGWTSPRDVWSVSVFADNVTDEEYVRSIFQQPVAFSSSYAPPRVLGVELRYRY